MSQTFREIEGSVVAPQGFLASGVFCDIKRLGTGKGSEKGRKRDLALIVSEVPAVAAGLFTTNQVCAAPVKVCLDRIKRKMAQAIVVNSGNANACTGLQGMKDALLMTELVAEQFRMSSSRVFVGSTGRIGVPLPMLNVKSGIEEAASLLGNAPEHAAEVAEAILTSDTRQKEVAVEFKLSGKTVRIGGICKGAGMIQPAMSANGRRPAVSAASLHATMLCFLTTDAAVDGGDLQQALEQAVAQSFNRITIDGDMSTNDTVLLLANGLAGNTPIIRTIRKGAGRSQFPSRNAKSKDAQIFQGALNYVCLELAKMIVRDGEGVSRFITVRVAGARSDADADEAARTVANSVLVKTSWNGGDPNWGRIIDALGYSSAVIKESKVDIGYSAPGRRKILWSLKNGQPTQASYRQLCDSVAPKEFDLHIHLNLGKGSALIYSSDLSEAYVDFNKGNVTDPASLGG